MQASKESSAPGVSQTRADMSKRDMRASDFSETDRRDPERLRYAVAVVVVWTVILTIAFI